MIATRESTAFSAISIAANTGTSTRNTLLDVNVLFGDIPEPNFPSRTKTSTGMRTVPIAPSGSRKQTFISIQVSWINPRSIWSVADRVAGHCQKHILESRENGPEIGHVDAAFGNAANHFG